MKLLALLRRPGPRLLWSGQVTSATGDRLYGVALIWITLRLTGSPAAVGLVTLADTLPFLATSLVSGALADRRDALRLARAVNLAQALIVAVIPAAYLAGHLDVPVLAAVACLLSALEAFCLPSLQASLPRLVEPRALTPMVSLLDSTDRLARVLGPGAISLLVVIVPEVHLFSLDAASLAVSAFCLSRVLRYAAPPTGPAARGNSEAASEGAARSERAAEPEGSAKASGRLAASLAGGWQVIWRHTTIRNAAALRTACNLAWPAFTIGVPFLVADRYHRGIGGYGLVLGAFGPAIWPATCCPAASANPACCAGAAWPGACAASGSPSWRKPRCSGCSCWPAPPWASAPRSPTSPLTPTSPAPSTSPCSRASTLRSASWSSRPGRSACPSPLCSSATSVPGPRLPWLARLSACAAITCAAVAALIRRGVTPRRPGRPGRVRRPGIAGELPRPPAAR